MKMLSAAALAMIFGAGFLPAPPAEAASYSCTLPRALLCENCANSVAITLTPAGNCRVTFTPGVAASAETGRQTFVFNVETPPALRRRTWQAGWRPPQRASTPPGKCFVFNNTQYCE